MALSSSSVLSGSIEGEINTFDEPTQISEISDKKFRVTLHKTYINNALYRVQGSDEEDQYESHIHVSHFDGQECKDLIRGYPAIIEKLFKNERCNISITDSSMICEFRDVIIPVRITLSKVAETHIEKMDKTIRKQERKIAELRDENKQLNIITGNMTNQIKTLEMLLNEVSERLKKIENRSPPIYPRKLKMLEESVKNLESKLCSPEYKTDKPPSNLAGKWIFNSCTIYRMTITCSENSFIVERSHLKDKIFHPSNMGWENGVFCWDIRKIHNHTTDVHYAFDSKDPSTILEINGDVKNIFKKE
jgi:hypothetical protein